MKYLKTLLFLFCLCASTAFALPECGEREWTEFTQAVSKYRLNFKIRPLSKAINHISDLNCEKQATFGSFTPLSYFFDEMEVSFGSPAYPGRPIRLMLDAGADINARPANGASIIADILPANSHFWLGNVSDVIHGYHSAYKADLNNQGQFGQTILHRAVLLDNSPTNLSHDGAILDLIAYGAKIETTDNDNQNAIEYYFTNKSLHGFSNSIGLRRANLLIDLAIEYKLTNHEFLLSPSSYIYGTSKDKMQSNFLALILLYGDDLMVKRVLNTNPALRLTTTEGISPLIAAIYRATEGSAYGADPNFTNVKYILDQGIDLNENTGTASPLWLSVLPTRTNYYQSHLEHNGIKIGLMNYLINRGADVSTKYKGESLVTYASTCVTGNSLRWGENENLALLKTALEKHVDPNEPNSQGKRPLQLAIETLCGQSTVNLLKQYGAN